MRAAALLSLSLVAAAPAPSVPVYRTFGRWLVSCDNTRSCEARGFGEGSRTDLRLLRAAGDARASLMLSAAETPLDPAAIHIDGATVALPAWIAGAGDPNNPAALSTDDPAALAAFIAAARNGHVLQLGPPGPDVDTVPLDGFTAALLLVDAVQGRPGTPTALVAPAGDGTVPPAPRLPDPPAWQAAPPLTAAEKRTLPARARALPSPADSPCDETEAPEVDPLDATRAIAIRLCERFAYQSGSLVYVLPRRGTGPAVPVVLQLPGLPKDLSSPDGPEMVEPTFDPATGRLSMAAKGRGLADCGQAATWVWSDGRFQLISASYQDQCGGSAPGDWPTLYRTKGAP